MKNISQAQSDINNIHSSPLVSIIVPVHNAERFLDAAFDSICSQSYGNLDIVAVDDGSTDSSASKLETRKQKDSRIRVFKQVNRGAGAARNMGLREAKGEYVIFLDADDLFDSEMISKSIEKILETGADIVAFKFCRLSPDGNCSKPLGLNTGYLTPQTGVFSWHDCPDRILSIVNPTPWNKLYRRAFLVENDLRFEEISSTNDITFAAVSVAMASKIALMPDSFVTYRIGESGSITSTKSKNLRNVIVAVESTIRQIKRLPYYEEIRKSLQCFVFDNCYFSLTHYVADLSSKEAVDFYDAIQKIFTSKEFGDVSPETFRNDASYCAFMAIRNNDAKEYARRLALPVVASLTSWPGRICSVAQSIKTLLAQTRKPDRIIIWLARGQFPDLEASLPEDLMEIVKAGDVELRWCDSDLKPHKKYFYALQEFPNSIVITFDDDLLYPRSLVERLILSYMVFPYAISTARANLMTMRPSGEPHSYEFWIKSQNALILQPSLLLLAGTGSGTLFPPGLLPKEAFNEEMIKKTCLYADDLWLKGFELLAGIPVVQISRAMRLVYVPGSQEVALFKSNVKEGGNDIQFANFWKWAETTRGEENMLKRCLSNDSFYQSMVVSEATLSLLEQNRQLSIRQETEYWKNSARKYRSRCVKQEKWILESQTLRYCLKTALRIIVGALADIAGLRRKQSKDDL